MELTQLKAWADRGWLVTLQERKNQWVVVVATHGFEMGDPPQSSSELVLRLVTPPCDSPETAICVAAKVLR